MTPILNTDGGIVRTTALAIFRLIANSNLNSNQNRTVNPS
jgi:hypothetical protein